jgi:hypothetical protein
MKTYKVTVQTNDGCVTFWYEKSRAKFATDIICRRIWDQLAGLNLHRVEVDLMPDLA